MVYAYLKQPSKVEDNMSNAIYVDCDLCNGVVVIQNGRGACTKCRTRYQMTVKGNQLYLEQIGHRPTNSHSTNIHNDRYAKSKKKSKPRQTTRTISTRARGMRPGEILFVKFIAAMAIITVAVIFIAQSGG
jgi:hypothetical protein